MKMSSRLRPPLAHLPEYRLFIGFLLGFALATVTGARADWNGSYNPVLDVNHDGRIDILDLQPAAGAWQTTGNPSLANMAQRKYFLTEAYMAPNLAPLACALAGNYHMASLWEIYDPSQLRYDSDNPDAFTGLDDQGEGPPANPARRGWIRTGGIGTDGLGSTPANCYAWTSTASNDYGVTVGLNVYWYETPTVPIHPWDVAERACNTTAQVWCVEN
jgi:hypothetical protein